MRIIKTGWLMAAVVLAASSAQADSIVVVDNITDPHNVTTANNYVAQRAFTTGSSDVTLADVKGNMGGGVGAH